MLTGSDNGFIVGSEGKSSRSDNVDWPAPPDEIGNIPHRVAIPPFANFGDSHCSPRQTLCLCYLAAGIRTDVTGGWLARNVPFNIHRLTRGRDPFIDIPLASPNDTLPSLSPHRPHGSRYTRSPFAHPFTLV